MASTYVRITRDELEDWLNTLHLADKWYRAENKAGVYMLPFSDLCAVKLSSTIGSKDDAMGRGMASMQLALGSRVTGKVLNKKAQGQSHFARTTNWKKNWQDGVERMKDAYEASQSFYEALAPIEDRVKYQTDLLTKIESHPDWRSHPVLSVLYQKVEKGGILIDRELKQIEVALGAPHSTPAQAESLVDSMVNKDSETEALLTRMRNLYMIAKRSGDQWLQEFLTNVAQQIKAGRKPTPKQQGVLDQNLARHRLACRRMVHAILVSTDFSTTPMSKPTAVRKLYKILGRSTAGFFSDESWQAVHKVFDLLKQAGVYYTLTRTEYQKNDQGVPSSKTWWLEVSFLNPAGKEQTIHSYIVAAGAGSVRDPLDRYDLTVVFN